ncbi:MAG TPA: OstA-like protein [Agriterribacter sp.]|nr:LPS export ABC transporter periplasmic protein LptC [Chitinophagaceae bacterium]HRP32053.1 OstA-like protein [Agriterribacter sp.]
MNTRIRIVLSVLFTLIFLMGRSQQKTPVVNDTATPSTVRDSVREVQLIRSDILKFEKKDSVELQILVGNAMLRQGNTLFNGDSIILNKKQNIIEVYGNIHINDADSINVFAQYLIYYGNTRIAHLRDQVKLSDGKATLTTNELEYDLSTKTGSYQNNGKIVTATSILTSKEGYYYADTKDAYFRKEVRLTDPEYTMATDTLLYNVNSEVATFVSPTTINDGKSIIRTSDGYYDMKLGVANFGKRPVIEDSTQYFTADNIRFDKTTGDGHAEGNFVYIDTAQGVSLFSEKSDFNRDTKIVLATGKPVMILKQENDSIFISGDSLYSGIMLDTLYQKDSSTSVTDTSRGKFVASAQDSRSPAPEINQDTTLHQPENARISKSLDKPVLARSNQVLPAINNEANDSLVQSAKTLSRRDSLKASPLLKVDRVDSVRFFQAFHHVRIFSDSMQAVCDSMYFSAKDSVFRLYTNPIVWAKESQITGDTIYLYTKNKKPEHIEVLENAFSISRSNDSFYNQIKGNVINGFFKDGEIEHITAKGSAESLYYLQDDDSAYTGANYAQADLINLYFIKKELDKITWLYDVKGGFYPVTQVPEERRIFRNFRWEEGRRPKTRMELFE